MRSLVSSMIVFVVACGGGANDPTVDASPAGAGDGAAEPGPVIGPDDTLDATTPGLYALPHHTYQIGHLAVALDTLLAETPDVDNVILYVHGRACGGGGEPGKSLAEVMPPLETDYQARALMIYWPGSDDSCPLGFPEDRARAAGPALVQILTELATYEHDLPGRFAARHLTLITHSLGNIVLEQAAESGALAPLPGDVFDTVMLASSATALAGHAAWLPSVAFSPHIYVSVNDGDQVLTAAGIGRGTRLGKNLGTETLAANASYVDFTASNVNHRYFIASGQHGAHMQAFYQDVMNGRAYDFAASTGITKVDHRDGASIYTFDGL
jgi:hypothetical protein